MTSSNKNISFQKIQSSLGASKWIIPIGLGLLVIGYMLWKNFNYQEFLNLSWNAKTFIFLILTMLVLVVRHLAYAWRLKMLCQAYFSWKKSIELIFIWEFASAISPTAVGGSATAMYFLSQEKIPGAKTVTVVLYTTILDTLFTLLSLALFLITLGPIMIGPDMEAFNIKSGYGLSFALVFSAMLAYGSFFFYALFINPKQISRLLLFLSRIKWLRRFKHGLSQTANDIQQAARNLRKKTWLFHLKTFTATGIAWMGKFIIIPIVILAVVQHLELEFYDFILLLARSESMFSITAFSPTPGGSGFAEALFGGFFKDFLNHSNALIIALIWRLLSYYSYLIAGVIIIPIWIRNLVKRRKAKN